MRIIHKYTLEITDEQTITVSPGFEFLSAQVQDGKLCIWAIVDIMSSKIKKTFIIIGTGLRIHDENNLSYRATVQMGEYVWHLFELLDE